jgi:hypothetical protein
MTKHTETANGVSTPEDFQILCVSSGRIHGRICGSKGSLLKVREEKCKREHCGVQVEFGDRVFFSSPDTFKTYANLWKGRSQVIPIQ